MLRASPRTKNCCRLIWEGLPLFYTVIDSFSVLFLELPDNDDDIETIELPPDNRPRLPAPFAVKEFLVHQEPLGSNQTEDKRFTGKLEQEDSFDEDSDESSTGDASAAMLNDESGNEDEGFDDSAYSGNRVIEFGKCS